MRRRAVVVRMQSVSVVVVVRMQSVVVVVVRMQSVSGLTRKFDPPQNKKPLLRGGAEEGGCTADAARLTRKPSHTPVPVV